ncbi:MAG: hypothetical protein HGB11_08585 [Chlorobiales bacterium]|nr:hypothetical protein [Chlorobiales bacterium]
MATTGRDLYDQDYRHFDVMIWQVPAWATALFALTAVASGNLLSNTNTLDRLHLDVLKTVALFIGAIAVVLLLLANVLVRFRLHQGALIRPPETIIKTAPWQIRGGTALLAIIFIEAGLLVAFALALLGFSPTVALITGGLFLPVSMLAEWRIRAQMQDLQTKRKLVAYEG